MTSPLVSVIIPNYNYARYIGQAVDSVLAQTFRNVEVIVVDDGSKDDSLEMLRPYGDKVRVIAQANQGVAVARNAGAAESRGEFLAFLDADDVWLPEKLERQLQVLAGDSDVGLVHCSMTLIDPDGAVCGESSNGKEGWISTDILRLQDEAVIGAGSTALVTRKAFDAAGGFDWRLSTAADWEFCYRVSVAHKIGYVPEPLVLYRIHNSNMHSNIGAMEHDVRIGYEKAFSSAAPELAAMRDDCYGNFHLMLSGSYYRAGNYAKAITNAFKSLWYKPATLRNFLGFPGRQVKKA